MSRRHLFWWWLFWSVKRADTPGNNMTRTWHDYFNPSNYAGSDFGSSDVALVRGRIIQIYCNQQFCNFNIPYLLDSQFKSFFNWTLFRVNFVRHLWLQHINRCVVSLLSHSPASLHCSANHPTNYTNPANTIQWPFSSQLPNALLPAFILPLKPLNGYAIDVALPLINASIHTMSLRMVVKKSVEVDVIMPSRLWGWWTIEPKMRYNIVCSLSCKYKTPVMSNEVQIFMSIRTITTWQSLFIIFLHYFLVS